MGSLHVWEKLACEDGPDGSDGKKEKDGTEGTAVEGSRLGSVLPSDLEVRRLEGSGGCHHFHWNCRGKGVFVLVQKNNNITLHTNLSFKIVNYSIKSAYGMMLLKNTTKGTYDKKKTNK